MSTGLKKKKAKYCKYKSVWKIYESGGFYNISPSSLELS